MQIRMNSFLHKISCDIGFSETIFKSRRGPTSSLSALLKSKNKNIPFFIEENDIKLTGKEGANFAKKHQNKFIEIVLLIIKVNLFC
jgi:hypothetical protein